MSIQQFEEDECRKVMEDDCQRKLLEDVFGESSSSSETDIDDFDQLPSSSIHAKQGLLFSPSSSTTINPNSCWQRIRPINGLWIYRGFLSSHQQSSLLSSIQTDLFAEGCFKESTHNQGICAHVDLMRFEDGIAIVSLESSCVMHFSPVEKTGEIPVTAKIPVYLTPGSLVIMWGDARYKWKHEINRKPGFQVWQGKELDQKRRTSITLRKLCISE